MDRELDLKAKLEKLDRDIFRTRLVAGLLFLCLAAASLANWARRPETVAANEFLLKDRTGNVVARLGQYDFGDTCLTLTAKQNVSVANLCVQDVEGSLLDLHNLKGESRATLTPGFQSSEPALQFRPALVINEAMNGHFAHINVGTDTQLVMGNNSKDSIKISLLAGEPKITLFGANEKPVWSTH